MTELSTKTERRLREIVRQSRNGHPGSFSSAWWVTGDAFEDCIFIVGAKTLKMYIAAYGKSIPSQSFLIGQTAANSAEAYADLAEQLSQAKGHYLLQPYNTYFGKRRYIVRSLN